jgi:hypothetical protein
MRAAFRLIPLLLIGFLSIAATKSALAGGPASAPIARPTPCWGTLYVTPAVVRIGGGLVLHGSHYTCRTPQGKLGVPTVVEMYQPGAGVALLDVTRAVMHAGPGGTYTSFHRVPRRLVTIASLMEGGQLKYVSTKPGTYWFTIQTFGVGPPPPTDQAMARINVIP